MSHGESRAPSAETSQPAASTSAYSLKHAVGTFRIREDDAGAWRVTHGMDELGAYRTAASAVEALARGDTYWLRDGTDPGTLGLPAALDAWTLDAA